MPERLKKKADAIKKVCETSDSFLDRFNPDYCAERYEKLNNFELALKSGFVKLSELKDIYDNDISIDMLRAWLLNLSYYLALDTDSNVVKTISRELYSEIFMLNLAELNLFFSRLRKGYYGQFYGRFDGLLICNAAREYRKSRGQILSQLPEEEQLKLI